MSKRLWWVVGGTAVIFSLVIGGLQWWKLSTFGYNGLDLGIYSQVAWSLGQGHGFASSIHDPSYLGDHLELWLIPMSWIYRLFPSPLTLLWIQTLLIAATLIPVAKLAHRYLGRRGVIGAAVLFLVNPLLYNAALYEFHALVVALPILAWTVWWYVERRYWAWLIGLLALLLVREDMPMLVAGWGVAAAFDRRNWRWWAPALALAVIWFPTAQAIIRAANHDGGYKYIAFYRWMGSSYGEILTYPFRHPWIFLQRVMTWDNVTTIVGLLLTVGFLPLYRIRTLIPLCFVFLQFFIGGAQPWSFLHIHYVFPYLPFLWWGAMVALRDILNGQLVVRGDRTIPAIVATILAIASPVYANFVMGAVEWPWNLRREQETAPIVVRQALTEVRPQDRVLATFNFLPALANRSDLYSLNYLYLGRRQYTDVPYVVPGPVDVAVIDWQQLYDYQFLYTATVFGERSGPQRIRDFLSEQGLSAVQSYGPVTVYRRGGSADQSVIPIPNAGGATTAKVTGPVALLGTPTAAVIDQPTAGWRELVVESAWRAVSTERDAPTSLRFTLIQSGRTVWEGTQLLGQGPTPSSEWLPDSLWQTRNVLVLPEGLVGSAELTMSIVKPHGRYRLDRLRTFRPIIDREEVLGTYTVDQVEL